ncbi:putative periplasmic protein kinase ArgK andrelated GTPases of G3E family [Nonlabens ulvanivorans]|uniref:Putative periplasmic protein kinase ArgK andrelated GTPases of G3E family n=1 Tax=Nonlabens ulvanivorans TaxID=906888 RepID=A0A081DAF8_NONUL|nr:putative periplasmic protein kinase ArgK andrelated GTPases of G3E family [Nonlabens ulvanivorans]
MSTKIIALATPSHINPHLNRKKEALNIDQLFSELHSGQVSALSRAITLVESTASGDSAFAKAIIKQALPESGKSFRLGITGVPGVGKSTFIEAIGKELIQRGKKSPYSL